MPSRPDPNRGEAVRIVMTDLVLAHGILGLTIRSVASGVGIAPSTLLAQFTHRERLLTWFSVTTGKRRRRQMEWFEGRHGWAGLLPRDGDTLETESTWSAVSELGRTHEVVGEVVHHQHEELCAHVRVMLREGGVHPEPDDVELLVAGIDGLRRAMVRQRDPMPLDQAARLLDRLVVSVVSAVRPSS